MNPQSCLGRSLRLSSRTALLTGTLATLLASSFAALGDTAESTWNGGTTNWSTGANWSNGVPSTGTSAVFNTSVTSQPTLTGASVAQGIWVTGTSNFGLTTISGGNTLTITGNATLDNIANAGILLDGAGNNSLTIDNTVSGVTVSNSTGFYVNNGGTLTIAAPLTITAAKVLTLGSTLPSGTGSILISGNIGTTTGAVTINGTGRLHHLRDAERCQ